MRAGELCALKWSDIDFKERIISITKTYYNPGNNITAYIQAADTENSKL